MVPRLPGLTSAQGILTIDVRHDLLQPLFQRASVLDEERVREAITRLETGCEALERRDASVARWRTEYRVDIRYFGQISGYMTMPLPAGDPCDGLKELIAQFPARHEREFGYALPTAVSEIEVVNLRAVLFGEVERAPTPAYVPQPRSRPRETFPVYFPGEAKYLETVCLERDDIRVEGTVEGPAIVSEWDSTIIVPPGATGMVSDAGDLILSLAP